MRALEQQQAQELLGIPHDPNAPNGSSFQHLAASAYMTPPRVNTAPNEEYRSGVGFSTYQVPVSTTLPSWPRVVLDNSSYNSYRFESHGHGNTNPNNSESTALYHHNGSRYGLGLGGRVNGADSKMSGFRGPKHKHGNINHKCKPFISLKYLRAKTNTATGIC